MTHTFILTLHCLMQNYTRSITPCTLQLRKNSGQLQVLLRRSHRSTTNAIVTQFEYLSSIYCQKAYCCHCRKTQEIFWCLFRAQINFYYLTICQSNKFHLEYWLVIATSELIVFLCCNLILSVFGGLLLVNDSGMHLGCLFIIIVPWIDKIVMFTV